MHDLDLATALIAIERLVSSGRGGNVFTCNVDHMMMLREDAAFRYAYERAALVTADGAPIVALGRLTKQPLRERVTGADLVPLLPAVAEKRGLLIALVGGAEGVADEAAEVFLAKHPRLLPPVCISPAMGFEIGGPEDAAVVRTLQEHKPDIIVVCFGAPKQELWMDRHAEALRPAVLLGAGASLDFIVSRQRRAPRLLQRLGLEWVWRLSTDFPRLWRRYLVRDARFLPLAVKEVVHVAFSRSRASDSGSLDLDLRETGDVDHVIDLDARVDSRLPRPRLRNQSVAAPLATSGRADRERASAQ
nr:WecB/TagA/CpsF family glycosyltransferase [Motilibacter deserti]